MTLTPSEGRISSAQLRERIITAAGFELCRVVVREAVLGHPVAEAPASLRERLRLAADAVAQTRLTPPAVRAAQSEGPVLPGHDGWDWLLRRVTGRGTRPLVASR